MLESTIRLFKALPVEKPATDEAPYFKSLRRGFIFAPEVVANYNDLKFLADSVEKSFGLTPEKLNASFHKSWNKIATADLKTLVFEQLLHYFTTYGAEAFGVYNAESVFVPREVLDIPDMDIEGFRFIVIHGLTIPEIKDRLLKLLSSGVALGPDTVKDVLEVAIGVKLSAEEIGRVKNNEVRAALYDHFNIVPENPVEFLRLLVYRVTGQTLLIKNRSLIEQIKTGSANSLPVLSYLDKYESAYGLNRLAEIFYRFKPLFLAFRTSPSLKVKINRLRKLAVKNHKPMAEDYLNSLTANITSGKVNSVQLARELDKVNTFRKIRLAYALHYRTQDVDSIMYRVRNGRSFATDFNYENKTAAGFALGIVNDSIVSDLAENIEGKKFYIPEYVRYALPSSERQFTGDMPSGTCIQAAQDAIVGVHWENVGSRRIDLDLSLVSAETGKIGWDASYRSGGVLFSGDMTDATGGATELFYLPAGIRGKWLLSLNYYNYDPNLAVPFKVLIANEKPGNFKQNYMVDPNNVVSVSASEISEHQKTLGIVVADENGVKFYFAETGLGRGITARVDKKSTQARDFLINTYTNSLDFGRLLESAGAVFVNNPQEADIDLTPESVTRDTILGLLY